MSSAIRVTVTCSPIMKHCLAWAAANFEKNEENRHELEALSFKLLDPCPRKKGTAKRAIDTTHGIQESA